MGEKTDGIGSGVRCDDNFACPNCEECGYFHEIEEEINVIDDECLLVYFLDCRDIQSEILSRGKSWSLFFCQN